MRATCGLQARTRKRQYVRVQASVSRETFAGHHVLGQDVTMLGWVYTPRGKVSVCVCEVLRTCVRVGQRTEGRGSRRGQRAWELPAQMDQACSDAVLLTLSEV